MMPKYKKGSRLVKACGTPEERERRRREMQRWWADELAKNNGSVWATLTKNLPQKSESKDDE